MKRRTLDLALSIGRAALAGLLPIAGLVLVSVGSLLSSPVGDDVGFEVF